MEQAHPLEGPWRRIFSKERGSTHCPAGMDRATGECGEWNDDVPLSSPQSSPLNTGFMQSPWPDHTMEWLGHPFRCLDGVRRGLDARFGPQSKMWLMSCFKRGPETNLVSTSAMLNLPSSQAMRTTPAAQASRVR